MRSLLHAPRTRKRSIAAATLGALALIGSLLVATPAHALNDTATGGVFVPATARVLDTKNNIGGYGTPMPAKAWRTVKVAGVAGVPDDGTVGAVSVVATVADIPGQGQLFGRPDANTSQTLMGIYGGEAKQNTSFSSVLAVSSAGTIQVYAETSVRLILDVQGYYTANTDGTAPGGFVPSNGKRVADSRSGTGIPKAQLTSGKSATLHVTGTAGVPAGASAVIVNFIAMNSTSSVGYLTPYATGATRPANSFNYAGDVITTMQAQVPLSADGKITIYNANSTIDLAIDVQGYFTAAGKGGAVFTPGQGRIVDTRNTGGNLAGNETRAYDVAGKAGVPVMGSGVNAVVLTLTSIATNGGGWGRVWANGTTEPDTASLRYEDGTIRTNTITVPLGANGKVNLHNIGAGATNFVIDVQGWYANPQAPLISCPAPYASGSWSSTIPADPIECTITVPAGTTSSSTLTVNNDGSDSSIALTSSATASYTALIANAGGRHSLRARIDNGSGVAESGEYSFGLGDWAHSTITGVPEANSTQSINPDFAVYSTTDDVPDNATIRYTVTDQTGTVVAASGPVTGTWNAPQDTLIAGQTYNWSATVTAPSAGSTADVTVQTASTTFSTTSADQPAVDASGDADNLPMYWGPGASIVAASDASARVPLGDGTALALPSDATVAETTTSYTITYSNGFTLNVAKQAQNSAAQTKARSASSYYAPMTFYYSRAQVKATYKAIKNYGKACGIPFINWWIATACSSSGDSLTNVIEQAYWQHKRVKMLWYRSKVCDSCSKASFSAVN